MIDNICIAYILSALVHMGWSDKFCQGSTITGQVMRGFTIHESHRSLFTHILQTLEKNEFLVPTDINTWQVMKTLTTFVGSRFVEGRLIFPTELNIIDRSGKGLHNELQGKVNGLQILFPNGSMDDTEALYERSALSEAQSSVPVL